MRTLRLLGVPLVFLLPAIVFALQVPFVGSPFEHMTVIDLSDHPAATTTGRAASAAGVSLIFMDEPPPQTEPNGTPEVPPQPLKLTVTNPGGVDYTIDQEVKDQADTQTVNTAPPPAQ